MDFCESLGCECESIGSSERFMRKTGVVFAEIRTAFHFKVYGVRDFSLASDLSVRVDFRGVLVFNSSMGNFGRNSFRGWCIFWLVIIWRKFVK